MIRHVVAAALLSANLAAAAAAQQVPTVQAGAGGRYETQLDLKTEVYGFSVAQVAAFRPKMQSLIDAFAAMPAVNAPPAPVCHRLESWLENASFHGLLMGEVRVMAPISFENGRCHRMTGTGVKIRLNDLSLLADPQQATVRVDGPGSDWFAMPQATALARVVRFGDAIGFTHGRAPLFRPVTTEAYLRETISRTPEDPAGGPAGELARWHAEGKAAMLAENAKTLKEMEEYLPEEQIVKIAEALQATVNGHEQALAHSAGHSRGPSERQRLEAELASRSLAERHAPACITPGTSMLDHTHGCPEGLWLVELNPEYFDKMRPDAVQLLVIETPAGRTHGESDVRLAARRAVWKALDHSMLADLVS